MSGAMFKTRNNIHQFCVFALIFAVSHSTFVEETPKATETIDKKNLLASRQICGLQSKDDRIDFRNNTRRDEYPWVVLLSYEDRINSEISYRCSGSLINTRYVLTSASCARPSLLAEFIRLGAYDVSSTGIDCVENPDHDECTDRSVDFQVEETIIHEKFNHLNMENDVALIRLAKPVGYSDYIRPICLPFEENTLDTFGKDVIISGWELIDGLDSKRVNAKKNSKSVIVNSENCTKFFDERFPITEKEICVRRLCDDGPCGADGGGPMMAAIELQWYQLGIASYGTRGCNKGSLTVGPKIVHHIDWILSKLKP